MDPVVVAHPSLLDRTRIPLRLEPTGDIPDGGSLGDAVKGATLAAASRFHLLKAFHWFLPHWDRLNFTMQHQQQNNWCWAAVSTSVALYFDPTTTWTQCTVANGELSRSDCCTTGASTSCNVYGSLASSLTRVGHLDHWNASAASFQAVDDEIDAHRPLGVRVAWSGGGAHFLAVVGYLEGAVDYVAVDDPIYGKTDLAYDTLKTAYQSVGDSWTHSYYTRA